MPVTARLSRKFYEALGDEIANELVQWFNEVDATYRSDLRELNDLNFARFDAKLEQRVAGLDSKIEQRTAELRAELARLEARLEARLDVGLAAQRSDLIKWMFVFWAGTIVPLAGLMITLHRL